MRWADGSIIMHGRAPYDPVKAHEYYLRTRQLKGRKKATTYTVNYNGRTVKLTARQLAEQKAYAAERIDNIKKKLSELNTKLLQAVREAKEKKAKSKREASKAPSAAEKSEAARDSRKYRDKHKQELATKRKRAAEKADKTSTTKKQSGSSDPVEDLVNRIGKVKKTLKDAVARQRALAGATRN